LVVCLLQGNKCRVDRSIACRYKRVMLVAFISDVHGNAIALEACLQQLRASTIDTIYFLGDAFGYLPAAKVVFDRLEREAIPCQLGNHEQMLLSRPELSAKREEAYRLENARGQFDAADFQRISAWPSSRELTLGSRTFLLVHGSPTLPLEGYVYPDSPLTDYHDLQYDAIVMAHTHRPFVRESGGKLFLNCGSVGLPRDRGDLASFVVYDIENHRAQIVRVELDVPAILKAYGGEISESVRACLLRK